VRLSRAKINHLSALVIEALEDDARVTLREAANDVRLQIVRILNEEVKRDALVDEIVREKIASQKRELPEGGREWDILYRQYYDEEMEKHRPPRE